MCIYIHIRLNPRPYIIQPRLSLTPDIVVAASSLAPVFTLDFAECCVGELVDTIAPNWAITRDVVRVEIEVVDVARTLRCLE